MNNEEAIGVLKVLASFQGVIEYLEQHSVSVQDACNMAIKSLSQEPCERFEWGIDGNVYKITKAKDGKEICQQVCDDAISRDWLKTAIHNFYYGLKHTPSEEDIQAYIAAAPFVTQKPTEGDDTVSRGVFEQVMRERDIAIEQLHELGYELGQKIEPLEVEAAKLQQAYDKGFEACRQAVLEAVKKNTFRLTFSEEQNCEGHVAWSAEAIYSDVIEGALLELSPVTQQYSKKVNCKSTKCENCINHNYCDYEPHRKGARNDT